MPQSKLADLPPDAGDCLATTIALFPQMFIDMG
jgi:hypothetical protein